MATTIKRTSGVTGLKKPSSALEQLRRQLSQVATSNLQKPTSRSTSGFGTSSAPTATGIKGATGGYSAPRPTSTSKLAPTSTPKYAGSNQAAAAGVTMGTMSAQQQQQLSNQLAATTGGAIGTPTATTTPGATATPASGFGAAGTGVATTPFGKSFTPDAADMMRSNPDALIAAYYKFAGLAPNGGEQAMSQGMNSERLRLLNVLFGKQGLKNGAGEFYPYADWAGGFLGQQRTPGAATYSTADVLRRMATTDPNDPVYNQLNTDLTPDAQADRWLSAYMTATQGNKDPYVQAAEQARLVQLQNEFIAQKGQGKLKDMTFTAFLKAQGFV